MERSGARALGARPREPDSASSAVLRVLRVDRSLSSDRADRGIRDLDRFKTATLESFRESDPLIHGV